VNECVEFEMSVSRRRLACTASRGKDECRIEVLSE
jgi:hypothetical protein